MPLRAELAFGIVLQAESSQLTALSILRPFLLSSLTSSSASFSTETSTSSLRQTCALVRDLSSCVAVHLSPLSRRGSSLSVFGVRRIKYLLFGVIRRT